MPQLTITPTEKGLIIRSSIINIKCDALKTLLTSMVLKDHQLRPTAAQVKKVENVVQVS